MKKHILSTALSAAVLAFPASQSRAAEYRIDIVEGGALPVSVSVSVPTTPRR